MIEIGDPLEISILVRLITAHLLTDFVFQKDSWIKDRFSKGWSSRYLYLHGLIAGMLAYLFSGQWSLFWLPVVVGVSHTLIDGFKAKKTDNILMFVVDQVEHIIILLIIWIVIIGLNIRDIMALSSVFFSDMKVWIILLAYVIIIWPARIVLDKATAHWGDDIGNERDEGLSRAGMWIGILERFMILTFILVDQFQAIGYLIAAKSILRFNQVRKIGEYILIGTLISFVIAIMVGLFVKVLICA